MRVRKENLEHAANKAVTTSLRSVAWPVYELYEEEERQEEWDDGKTDISVWIVAPRPALNLRKLRVKEEGHQTYYWRWWEQDEGVVRWYAPLRCPDLLLRLAELGESGQITLDKMLLWAREFGLLGISDPEGRRESLIEFTLAAERVARILRLYESAEAPGGPNAAALKRYGIEGRTTHHLKEAALKEVVETVADHLETRAYPVPYRSVLTQTGETVGFTEGPGFRSLLGAVYIQMMWLMKAGTTVRRCKREGCTKIITFEIPEYSDAPRMNERTGKPYKRGPYKTRADKEFCGPACKRNWHYHNVEKAKKARSI